MPSEQEILDQKEILETYRRTLAVYLRQRAASDISQISPVTMNGIRETREHIHRIKQTLSEWGVSIFNHPDDEENFTTEQQDSSYGSPRPQNVTTTTGTGSVNIGVGHLPNSKIHVGNIYKSSVFPYEFIEVRFFAQALIVKVPTEVTRLFVFKGQDLKWPAEITFDVIASISGSIESETVLAQGQSHFVEHMYKGNYNNAVKWVSLADVSNGLVGSHDYYPIDLRPIQQYIVHFLNSLGAEKWELLNPPHSLGNIMGKFDIYVSPPRSNSWTFPGGIQRFYVGQKEGESEGIVYSLKRSKSEQ